jgi:hypothetical protein
MAIRAMRFSVLLRRLMSDKEVVLEAVKQGGYSGYALQRASEEADERQGGRAGGCEAGWLFRLCASACF